MLDPITLAVASQALDVAGLRQRVIATNIANAQTAGYVPQRVAFEEFLDGARDVLRQGLRLNEGEFATPAVVARRRPASLPGGADAVQLDAEVAEMASNGTQYQALVKAVSGQYALMDMAISGGKR